ncbi:MAG: ABC transporter permease [Acidimicrobiales bacterium]
MGARLLVARAELRRSAVTLVVLGMVAAAVGATVTGVATVARRSATAYERLEQASNVDDARGPVVAVGEQRTAALVADLNAIDGVAAARVAPLFISRFREGPVVFPSFAVLEDDPTLPFQPVVVAGRTLDPRAPDEVVMVDSLAQQFGIGVGAVLPLRLLRQEEFFAFGADLAPPVGKGPEVDLTVVGLIRVAGPTDAVPPLFAGPAFRDAHPDAEPSGVFDFVRLRDPRELAAFERSARQLGAPVEIPESVTSVALTSSAVHPSVTAATRLAVGALIALGGVVALAGLALIAQIARRRAGDSASATLVLEAIGFRRLDLAVVALVPALGLATLAAGGAVLGGVVGGHVAPIGVAATFDPAVGARLNVTMVLIGALVASVAVLASMLGAHLLARPRSRARPHSTSGVVQRLARLGTRPSGIVGLRYVFERGERADSTLSGIVSGAIGVAGVVGALVVGINLHRTLETPLRYGWPTELVIADANEAKVSQIRRDPRVATIVYRSSADVELDGRAVNAVAIEELRGSVRWWLSRGRPARDDSEIVLGVSIARSLGKHVGDVVVVEPLTGPELTLKVVGEGVVPSYGDGAFGRAVAVTPRVLQLAATGDRYDQLGIEPAASVPPEQLMQDLGDQFEMTGPSVPPSVANLDQIRAFPMTLGIGLGLLAVIATAYAVTGMERSRRHDLAVLTALGFTRRNRLGVVITFATALALLLAAAGGIAGLIAGSGLWRTLAGDAALASTTELPAALALALPATAMAAVALSGAAAIRTWRASTGADLRAE